jgi:hypothetical protein
MSQQDPQIVQRLRRVLEDLYAETASLSVEDSDLQLWYNRGYADGMLKAMMALGYARQLAGVQGSGETPPGETDSFLPWGKAYHHGSEVGERETYEVLG